LWIIPVLIIYSYIKKETGLPLVALGLSVVVLPIWSFSIFLTGTEYIWIPLNLPADTAILAVLPSTLVTLGLIGITCSKGPLAIFKTWKGMLFSASLALWFSFGFAYYAYYGVPPLGVLWYFILIAIISIAATFLYRKLRSKKMNSNVQLSAI
jgi:hypothetical protein